jgi:hypothetical protein
MATARSDKSLVRQASPLALRRPTPEGRSVIFCFGAGMDMPESVVKPASARMPVCALQLSGSMSIWNCRTRLG